MNPSHFGKPLKIGGVLYGYLEPIHAVQPTRANARVADFYR